MIKDKILKKRFSEYSKFLSNIEEPTEDLKIYRESCGISELKRINYQLKTDTLEIYRVNGEDNYKIEMNQMNWYCRSTQLWEETFVHDCWRGIMRFCGIYFIEKRSIFKSGGYDYVTIYRTETGPGKGKELIIDLKYIAEEIKEKFLKIPFSSQYKIIGKLDLITDSDEDKSHEELIDAFVFRAEEKMIISEFYELINSIYEKKEIDNLIDLSRTIK